MNTHNSSMDVVRVIGAFCVMFCHIGQSCGLKVTGQMAQGVQLFFILSGFLIFQSLNNTETVKDYYLKRILRIIPIYWITLCINYIFQLLWSVLIERQTLAETVSTGACGIRYLRYFTLFHMVIPTDNYQYWNNAFAVWTISSFAVFYIIAPVLYRLINRFWKAMVVVAASMCLRPITVRVIRRVCLLFFEETEEIGWFATGTPLNTIYCFLIGIAIYYAVKERQQFVFTVFFALLFVVGKADWYPYEIVWAFMVLTAAMCPIETGAWKNVIKIMSGSSFALYLIHPVMIKIANFGMAVVGLGGAYVKVIVLTLCCVSGGLMYWYWVEMPVNRKLSGLLKSRG